MIMKRVGLVGLGQGGCISVNVPGVGTSSDCSGTLGESGGYYVDAGGNLITYDAAGNVTKVPASLIPAAPGQTGQPVGGATGQTSPSLATTPGGYPGPGLGLCTKVLGTGPVAQVICTPWFLVALFVVGGILVFKIIR